MRHQVLSSIRSAKQQFVELWRREEVGKARIWAVGGGKGGVGKSIVTSSLAIKMARTGERVVVVDADLGGANLHTVLGVESPRRTLSHFLARDVSELADVMVPGPVANLSVISGAQALYDMASPQEHETQRLLEHIRRLDVDHVFLDLGAGSAFNIVDHFLAAHRGILVVTPEPTSIENAYHFLKVAFFRSLRRTADDAGVRSALDRVKSSRVERGIRSPRQLIEAVESIDARAARQLREAVRAFAPMLIVNKVQGVGDRRVGEEIERACREYLGTSLEHVGSLERDECVRIAVAKSRPVVDLYPNSRFSTDVGIVVDRLKKEDRGMPLARVAEDRPFAQPLRADVGREAPSLPLRRAGATGHVEMPTERVVLPALDLDAPAAYLKRCRTQLGLTLEFLTERTRIRCLAQIENEQFDQLPPEPNVRSFVSTYARTMGIRNPDALAASFVARMRAASANA